jgi:hypothetical protein
MPSSLGDHIVKGDTPVNIIRDDPPDNAILACALVAEAHFIVTGRQFRDEIARYHGGRQILRQTALSVKSGYPSSSRLAMEMGRWPSSIS